MQDKCVHLCVYVCHDVMMHRYEHKHTIHIRTQITHPPHPTTSHPHTHLEQQHFVDLPHLVPKLHRLQQVVVVGDADEVSVQQ